MAFNRIVVVTFITVCLASNITCLINDAIVSNKEVSKDAQDPNVGMLKSLQVQSIAIADMERQREEAKGDAIKKGHEIINKIRQSRELSNSTHIDIESFFDILEDISSEIEYIQHILTSSAAIAGRSKRSLPFISYFMGFARPIFKSVATSLARSIDGHDNTLTSQLILPIIFDMIDDPVTFNDLQKLFWSAQSVISPIFYETMRRQQQGSRYGANYHIPQATIDSALRRLDYETKPILRKIMERQLPMILRRVSQNVRLIIQTIERVERTSGPKVHVLKMQLLEFVKRHGDLFGSAGTRYINSHTLVAMKQDLIPIKTTLFEIFMDYMSHSPNSWGNLISNSFSVMGRF